MGCSINKNAFIETTKYFECKTDWIELNCYSRKLKIDVQRIDNKATAIIGKTPCNATNFNKALLNHQISRERVKDCFFCDFWHYHKLHLSWIFHWNSSNHSEDIKMFSVLKYEGWEGGQNDPLRKNYSQKA